MRFVYKYSGLKAVVESIEGGLLRYRLRLNIVPVSYKLFLVALGGSIGASGMFIQYNYPALLQSNTITIENKLVRPVEAETINNDSKEVQTLKKVGSESGVDWKILAGIFKKETQGDCDRMGDWQMSKPSIGCFQISLHYHPEVKMSQATDLEWSAKWTADRLKKVFDKTGSWDLAIMSHNGDPNNPTVQQYLKDVKSNINDMK